MLGLSSQQAFAQKDGPTIGFISPDVVSDIGKQKLNITFCSFSIDFDLLNSTIVLSF